MNDDALFRSSGLYDEDFITGTKGFNMAAVLLFGKDEVIKSCVPGYVTDAIYRVDNLDRYDDRLLVDTNLIESYELLTEFIAKHTSDKFFLINDINTSIRNLISRELVANTLIHREYSSAFPAKIIIEANRIFTENWNKTVFHTRIYPDSFTPYPKNPLLARFFVNIGLADTLGSGVRNLYKYTKMYSGNEPVLIEDDVFTTTIPLIVENIQETRESIQESIQESIRESIRENLNNTQETHRNTQEITQETQIDTQDITQESIREIVFTKNQIKIIEQLKLFPEITQKELAEFKTAIVNILDTIYNPQAMKPENARANNVELKFNQDKFNRKEFQELWKNINSKTAYVVDFETDELIQKSISKLDLHLHISKIFYTVSTGSLETIKSKETLLQGEGFKEQGTKSVVVNTSANANVKYDLIGKIVEETGLTRNSIVKILTGIKKEVFEQFKFNPEEFIQKTSNLINEEKATVIVQHIAYNKLEDCFGTEVFTDPTMKGKLDVNAIPAEKHLYDYIIFDSPSIEKPFAEKLDASEEVSVYVKLPKGFYITTPVGKYNPDWAIAFNKGTVKHIYFVAETKGSMSTLDLRLIEDAKIHCAREHFKAISTDNVKYDVVNNYQELLKLVK